ncbi:MAG: biotin transporter BioY [Clostridiales bacterium]|jgi:biotin transport system substrate-specific component|nr:biotin transporter BioY [Clostridiales bacterium]
MSKQKHIPVYRLTLGGLYIALFGLASNIPLLSAINIIPGVPITMQTFLIAMMGLTLGLRGGLITYIALLVLTFCGLPMMAGGKGGPAVFVGPTCGYIYGWVFVIILLGLYSTFFMDRLVGKRILGMSIHLPVSFGLGMLGMLLDYACGSLGLIATGADKTMAAFPAVLLSNAAFLPADAIKFGLASVISLSLFAKPALRRFLNMGKAVV